MDIFESISKINEQEESYTNNVPLSIHFETPGLDDDNYVESPDNRSWGIKDINVSLRGVLDFEIIIRSELPEEEGKEVVVPVHIDFVELEHEQVEVSWLEGSGIAPAELHVILGGTEGKGVVKVEVDFYYWKP